MKNIKKIQAVVFDWSGTTVDFGCRAPLAVIMEIFKKKGLPITVEEASKPMGMLKIDHFKELFKMDGQIVLKLQMNLHQLYFYTTKLKLGIVPGVPEFQMH